MWHFHAYNEIGLYTHDLEILSISKSKSIRVISKTYKVTFMHYVQSYLYILENEFVTLGDEFLSVDQLLILAFLCHSHAGRDDSPVIVLHGHICLSRV